jgi:uncharacterized protein (DUF302 family)
MITQKATAHRLSVTSSKSFEAVIAQLEASIGHPDMRGLQSEVGAAKSQDEADSIVQKALGQSGLMEVARMDLGVMLRKEPGYEAAKSLRFLIGNPLVMKELVKRVPDAGSYAPVTILIDERRDGVHLSYDLMADFLAPYDNEETMRIAQDLDAKVEKLLREVAG